MALFRAVHGSGRLLERRLTDGSIRHVIIRRARDAGVEGRVSGHGLRTGSAQRLATAGVFPVETQPARRRQPPFMPGRCAKGQPAKQGAVAGLRGGLRIRGYSEVNKTDS
ncbi:MAG: hypothetical protein F4X83_01295 [Chloroflexi bacterium]|nr:hypothetical protein [Chloroflexota bacterium]